MRRLQRGLSLFGALVIVAIAVVALYYVYKGVTGENDEPSCRSAYTSCLQNCRRTRTEAADLQRCQEGCQRDVDACERPASIIPRRNAGRPWSDAGKMTTRASIQLRGLFRRRLLRQPC